MKSKADAWFLILLHSPLLVLWIIIAGMTVAAVIDLFRNPHRALELTGAIAAMGAFVKFVARVRGVSPWPISVDDDDDDVPDPLLTDGNVGAPPDVELFEPLREERRDHR